MGHLQRFRRLGLVFVVIVLLQGCSTILLGLSGDYSRKDGIHLSVDEIRNGRRLTVRNDNPHRTWVKVSARLRRLNPDKERMSPYETTYEEGTFTCALPPGQSQSWPLTFNYSPGPLDVSAHIDEVQEYAEGYLAVGDRLVLRNLTDLPASFHLSCPVTVEVTDFSTTSYGRSFRKLHAQQLLRVDVVGKERQTILSTRSLTRDSEDPRWPTSGVVECAWVADSTKPFSPHPKITLRFSYSRIE